MLTSLMGLRGIPESNFTVSAQATILYNKLERYTFKLINPSEI